MQRLSLLFFLSCFAGISCAPNKAALTLACDSIAEQMDACMDADRKFRQACAEGDSLKIAEQLLLLERSAERSLNRIRETEIDENFSYIRESGMNVPLTYCKLIESTYKPAIHACGKADTGNCNTALRIAEKQLRYSIDLYNQKLDILVKEQHIITGAVYYH